MQILAYLHSERDSERDSETRFRNASRSLEEPALRSPGVALPNFEGVVNNPN
jgi:hypothetical protein